MSFTPKPHRPKKSSNRSLVIAACIAVLFGFTAVYVNLGGDGNDKTTTKLTETKDKVPPVSKPDQSTADREPDVKGLNGLNIGQMTAFVVHEQPKEIPEITFVDSVGDTRSINEWKGKVVLLNLWATWCGPCRKEMPDFDKLKSTLTGDNFDVVAVSVDRGGLEKPRIFLRQMNIKDLELFNNSSGKLASSLRAFGMPTTLLLDRQGREIGRLVGPAVWKSEEAVELIQAAVAMP